MNDPYKQIKKPHGCWKWSGCMLTIVSALLIAFFVWMIVDSEREMCVADCFLRVDDCR